VRKDEKQRPTLLDRGTHRPGMGQLARTAALDTLIQRVRADLDSLPVGEKAVVAGGLYVLDRCARAVERIESLVEEQRESVRRGRQILELFPPLLGKLGELLDTELADAKARLEDRLKGRR